jgi:hypothetical protein
MRYRKAGSPRLAGDDPARRIEAIKTGLTVATVTGGFLALLLAFRRGSVPLKSSLPKPGRRRRGEHEQRDRDDQIAVVLEATHPYWPAAVRPWTNP